MFRRLRDWWPFLWRPILADSILVVEVAVLGWLESALAYLILGILAAGIVSMVLRRRWIWRLLRRCWHFDGIRTARVVLLYEPDDDHHPLELWVLARMVEREMDGL